MGQPTPSLKNGMKLYRYIDPRTGAAHAGGHGVARRQHLQLLSAFTNSRLHQVTQCHWDVCREKLALYRKRRPGAVSPGRGGISGVGPGATMGPGGMKGTRGRGDDVGDRNKIYRGTGGRPGGFGLPGAPGMGQMSMGGPLGGGQGKMLSGVGRPGMMPGGQSFGGASDGEDEENLNLLEVAIYGIASIYEEFPPRPAAAATADATGAAAQPGTQPKP